MKIEEVEIDIGNELQENAGTSNADKVQYMCVCVCWLGLAYPSLVISFL